MTLKEFNYLTVLLISYFVMPKDCNHMEPIKHYFLLHIPEENLGERFLKYNFGDKAGAVRLSYVSLGTVGSDANM